MAGFSGIETSWSMKRGRNRSGLERAARVATAGLGRVGVAAAEAGGARYRIGHSPGSQLAPRVFL